MPLDFKARQIRTGQLIASGSVNIPIMVYNSGSALDYYGGFPAQLVANVGKDVFLFVSGGIGEKGTNKQTISLFGGDLVVSGTIYNGAGTAYSAGAASAGSAGWIQYSDGLGGFSAEAAFIYNSTTNKLSIDNVSIGSQLEVSGSTYIGDNVGNDYLYVNARLKTDIIPDIDRNVSLGSSNYRFANIYTGDLHLRNDRGNWTIVEEAEYLCVVNNLTGKRYKMMLEPLD